MEPIVLNEQTATQPPGTPSYTYTDYKNATYHIVSLVGYLIGVEKQYFAPPGNRNWTLRSLKKRISLKTRE